MHRADSHFDARFLACGSLLIACVVGAAPPPVGTPDSPPPTVSESEANNTFATRDTFAGSNACKWDGEFFARLGPRDTGHPDTYLGFYDILGYAHQPGPADMPPEAEVVVALDVSPEVKAEALAGRAAAIEEMASGGERGGLMRNDDGGPYRRWGGSRLSFLQEGPFGSAIRITGKNCDPLDFGGGVCVHGQAGTYEAIVEWYAAGNAFIGRTIYRATLNNNDLDEYVLNPPAGTFDFDVTVKPLGDYVGDVDFFQVNGLRPGETYSVSTHGLHARHERTLDTILRQYNGAGAGGAFNDDVGLVNSGGSNWWNRNSVLAMVADGGGSLRFAVTGWNDFDFDGFEDPDDDLLHDEQGSYTIRVTHVCAVGCADVDGNCEVNFADITALLRVFGDTCQ